jgi:hypothetical protein
MKEIDAIILARGGGPSEDFMVFNDEMLVRAIASSTKPIITSIGHEVMYAWRIWPRIIEPHAIHRGPRSHSVYSGVGETVFFISNRAWSVPTSPTYGPF